MDIMILPIHVFQAINFYYDSRPNFKPLGLHHIENFREIFLKKKLRKNLPRHPVLSLLFACIHRAIDRELGVFEKHELLENADNNLNGDKHQNHVASPGKHQNSQERPSSLADSIKSAFSGRTPSKTDKASKTNGKHSSADSSKELDLPLIISGQARDHNLPMLCMQRLHLANQAIEAICVTIGTEAFARWSQAECLVQGAEVGAGAELAALSTESIQDHLATKNQFLQCLEQLDIAFHGLMVRRLESTTCFKASSTNLV
jgi:hypothetical protein